MSEAIELAGQIQEWDLAGARRRFVSVCLPYGDARRAFQPKVFDAVKGVGEQRNTNNSQVKVLKAAYLDGTYTPAPVAASLRKHHQKEAVVTDNLFSLTVDPREPLALTDGGHRFRALGEIMDDLIKLIDPSGATPGGIQHSVDVLCRLVDVPKEPTREQLVALAEEAIGKLARLPVQATVYVDGDVQLDFLNLQKGRAVDKSHILSLTAKKSSQPDVRLAIEVAKLLDKSDKSPFYQKIRFDTTSDQGVPLTTLCARGSSDLATSLVGLARSALADAPKDAKVNPGRLATLVEAAAGCVPKDLAVNNMVLGYHKSKGAATMVCGLGLAMYHLCEVRGRGGKGSAKEPTKDTKDKFEAAVVEELNEEIQGGFSGPQKREYMRRFMAKLFQGEDTDFVAGLPKRVLDVIPHSAFGVRAEEVR